MDLLNTDGPVKFRSIKVKMEFTHEDDEAHLTDDEGDGNDEYLEISDTVSTVVSLCISTRSVHTRTRLFFIKILLTSFYFLNRLEMATLMQLPTCT